MSSNSGYFNVELSSCFALGAIGPTMDPLQTQSYLKVDVALTLTFPTWSQIVFDVGVAVEFIQMLSTLVFGDNKIHTK
jgi:hypothetical protein